MNLQDKTAFLKFIAGRVQLREGAQGVESVVRAIFEAQTNPGAEDANERTLARITRLPMPVVNAIRFELQRAGVLDDEGPGIHLTLDALKAVDQSWGWSLPKVAEQPEVSATCKTCGGTGVALVGHQWDAAAEALRRHPKHSAVTPETDLRRVVFMHEIGALAGKDVLVMGDDISVAVGVAVVGKSIATSGKLVRRIVALHPDEKALNAVRDRAVRENTIIGLVRHDTRRSLMQDLEGEFDTVFIAPSALFSSIINLLSRAIEAAKPDGGRVFLACPPLSLDDRVDAQRAILDLGLAIERLVPGFDKYDGGKSPGDLYVLSVTEESAVNDTSEPE